MEIKLSDHFTYKKLFKFTLPSIAMMVFTSIYGVVDGFFVSNFVGKTPFAAVNLIWPFLMIMGTVGFMFGTGGSAIVAKTLGEGDHKKANEYFSLYIYVSFILGVIIAFFGIVFLPQVTTLIGGEGEMHKNAVLYGRINLLALPFYILQMEFQTFFVTAEKPKLGLYTTVASGVTNMVLDALLVGVFSFGIVGAAFATALSQVVGGVIPLIYFAKKNDSLLSLGKTRYYGKAIVKACVNGSSELMSNISMSVVGMLYNVQLLKYAGEDGVAAYGVIMYVSFIFAAAFIGYSIGTAPVFGFNFGAQNHTELKNVLNKSIKVICISAIFMLVTGIVFAAPLSKIFVGYDPELLSLTARGFKIYSLCFLFMGMAIFGSGFFTALSDGVTSAFISFLRTLVFQILAVMLLPLVFKVDGIWISVVVAEFMAAFLSVVMMILKRKQFHY